MTQHVSQRWARRTQFKGATDSSTPLRSATIFPTATVKALHRYLEWLFCSPDKACPLGKGHLTSLCYTSNVRRASPGLSMQSLFL